MARSIRLLSLVGAVAALALTGCGGASSPPAGPDPASGEPSRPGASGASSGPRAYADVVPSEAESDIGLFTVHRVDGSVLYEIPDSLLGRDMLLISRIAQTPTDMSPFLNAGSKVGEQVLRWERREDRVLLRRYTFERIADDSLPVAQSVASNNFAPILMSFELEAIGPDSQSVVVDVTDLFETDVAAISGLNRGQRQSWGVRALDRDRTFVDYARAYPLNVDVRHTLTFAANEPPSNAQTGTISMQMHQSMVLLPAEPMRVRYADPRVGWFSIERVNFGLDEQKAASQEIIRRWRLEPRDPEAYARGELVEPVKPIVYYLDPATPAKWRPYMRAGIEDWQAAFEAAGFKNAVVARDAPTPEEDPEWSPEDVRYSTVRWVANLTRNAVGPSVSDPRSGEIIESDVIWYHNHMRSYRNRLMIETGAANPEARTLRQPDELVGETMRQVIAHELGHALGLPHNMIASSAFPVDSLRSPTFTERFGVAPTIMDYARQNYIAQPGDGVTRFIRKIGPYDHYAIEWGYRIIPDAATPEDERPVLDRWIAEHEGDPVFRFGSSDGVNPWAQTEDMGDDPVRASGYAIENLKRVAPNLVEWTASDGEGYDDLSELYGELLGQWNRYIGHVVTLIGGVYETRKTADQEGWVYEPVPAERQRGAMRFLGEQLFETPTWLQDAAILRRIQSAGAVERMRSMQVGRLNQLLDPSRMGRLIEASVFDANTYTLLDMMTDLRESIWREARPGRPIDAYRRNLQRGYLERLAFLMEDPEPPRPGGGGGFGGAARRPVVNLEQSDIRAIVRDQLLELRQDAVAGARLTGDRMTRIHLLDVVERIDEIVGEG